MIAITLGVNPAALIPSIVGSVIITKGPVVCLFGISLVISYLSKEHRLVVTGARIVDRSTAHTLGPALGEIWLNPNSSDYSSPTLAIDVVMHIDLPDHLLGLDTAMELTCDKAMLANLVNPGLTGKPGLIALDRSQWEQSLSAAPELSAELVSAGAASSATNVVIRLTGISYGTGRETIAPWAQWAPSREKLLDRAALSSTVIPPNVVAETAAALLLDSAAKQGQHLLVTSEGPGKLENHAAPPLASVDAKEPERKRSNWWLWFIAVIIASVLLLNIPRRVRGYVEYFQANMRMMRLSRETLKKELQDIFQYYITAELRKAQGLAPDTHPTFGDMELGAYMFTGGHPFWIDKLLYLGLEKVLDQDLFSQTGKGAGYGSAQSKVTEAGIYEIIFKNNTRQDCIQITFRGTLVAIGKKLEPV